MTLKLLENDYKLLKIFVCMYILGLGFVTLSQALYSTDNETLDSDANTIKQVLLAATETLIRYHLYCTGTSEPWMQMVAVKPVSCLSVPSIGVTDTFRMLISHH